MTTRQVLIVGGIADLLVSSAVLALRGGRRSCDRQDRPDVCILAVLSDARYGMA